MLTVPLTAGSELRSLDPWQAEEFLVHLDRARAHIAPWVSASFVAADLAEARAVLQRYADKRAADTGGIWGIWLEGTLVGGVMFVSFDTERGVCEVGCWLEPGAQGRGLITRAVERLVRWAVDERGIERIEWRTKAANARSISVAERLGLSREDVELWSLRGEDWRKREVPADSAEIDRLTAAFFGLFGNEGGARPDAWGVHRLFVPGGLIVQGGARQEVYDLDSFARPRQELLTSGELTDFAEEETSHHTEIFGDIALRTGRYRKRGVRGGVPFTGQGTKCLQFLRTPQGWRISALSWTDDQNQKDTSG
ncbi:GNAT family N-acetyltransferase [Nonomuraea endophytica]|uniref:GNAT family N-acetyltransferase n=1 Tax=Nonomuraea endophytica TaxID=714136 RepID=UPI0037C842FE